MDRYHFTEQMQTTYESMQVPFAIYQFINKRIVTIALSDGFCELFGYDDKAQAYHDMDHNMYKDTHPDDMARIEDAAFRFATEDGKYEVIYRTAMKDSAGYRIVMHVHDEVVIEAPMDTDVDTVCKIMSQTPSWAPGLILNAAGYECMFYQKD